MDFQLKYLKALRSNVLIPDGITIIRLKKQKNSCMTCIYTKAPNHHNLISNADLEKLVQYYNASFLGQLWLLNNKILTILLNAHVCGSRKLP